VFPFFKIFVKISSFTLHTSPGPRVLVAMDFFYVDKSLGLLAKERALDFYEGVFDILGIVIGSVDSPNIISIILYYHSVLGLSFISAKDQSLRR
jgi:hypothetical protein